MNGKVSPPQLTTSHSIPSRGADYRPPDFRENICWVLGCKRPRSTNIRIFNFPKKSLPVLFGMLPDTDHAFDDWTTLDDWWHYPDDVWVCSRHYGSLRNKHGVDLAYRYRQGTLKVFPQGYWF